MMCKHEIKNVADSSKCRTNVAECLTRHRRVKPRPTRTFCLLLFTRLCGVEALEASTVDTLAFDGRSHFVFSQLMRSELKIHSNSLILLCKYIVSGKRARNELRIISNSYSAHCQSRFHHSSKCVNFSNDRKKFHTFRGWFWSMRIN